MAQPSIVTKAKAASACVRQNVRFQNGIFSSERDHFEQTAILYGLCPFIIIINSAGRYSVMKEIINYSRRVMSDERIMKGEFEIIFRSDRRKIEKFRSALRAEMLQFHNENEAKIEKFRSALRAERLHRILSVKSMNFCEISATISPKYIMKD